MEYEKMAKDQLIDRIRSLEKENEDLRRIEGLYGNLVDNSLDGIMLTLAEGGVVAANTAAQTMLGRTEEEIRQVGRDGITVNDENLATALEERKRTGEWQGELMFLRKDGTTFPVQLSSRLFSVRNGLVMTSTIFRDITERKETERRLGLTTRILEALNVHDGKRNLVHSVLLLVKEYTGVEAVGIRLREGDDFPYFETSGFTAEFVELERSLCGRDDNGEVLCDSQGNPCLECMCGNVIRGRTDPSLPFFTRKGSFWSNNTTQLLAMTSDEDRQTRTRNRCNGEGYESVALIPLRSGEEILGLVQLNDSRHERFDISMIEFLEHIAGSVGIAVERQRNSDRVATSEEKYRSIFDNSVQGIFQIAPDGKILDINASHARMYGYTSPEEMIREVTVSRRKLFVHGEDQLRINNLLQQGGTVSAFETEQRRKDGSTFWLSLNAGTVRDGEGKIEYVEGIAEDITERKRVEEALKTSEEKYRRIVDASNEGICVFDEDFELIFANKHAAEMLGYAENELAGSRANDFIFPEDIDQLELTKQSHREGNTEQCEQRLRRRDGSALWVMQSAVPLVDERNRFQGSLVMITDISELKETQEMLRLKTNSLEEMNNALTVLLKRRETEKGELSERILINVRELIGPYIEKLRRSKLDERQKGLLDVVQRNMEEITSPLVHNIFSLGLTPREIEIASLIKLGATTKEIADKLNLSLRAVETHRFNVRKRLGLNVNKANLRSYLLSLS
jgi:PAS domain S-box-containing protein